MSGKELYSIVKAAAASGPAVVNICLTEGEKCFIVSSDFLIMWFFFFMYIRLNDGLSIWSNACNGYRVWDYHRS